jgi:HJR/Mrr/RecB family endonuclease
MWNKRNYFSDFKELIVWLLVGVLIFAMAYILAFLTPYYIQLIEYGLWNPTMWIVIAFLVLILSLFIRSLIRKYKKEQRRKKYMAIKDWNKVLNFTPREFEEFTEYMLISKGYYPTELWRGTKDGGIDVTAFLGNQKYLVQCKHYSKKNIGIKEMRELNGIMNWKAKGIFVTTSDFAQGVSDSGRKYWIELWNREEIEKFLKQDSSK